MNYKIIHETKKPFKIIESHSNGKSYKSEYINSLPELYNWLNNLNQDNINRIILTSNNFEQIFTKNPNNVIIKLSDYIKYYNVDHFTIEFEYFNNIIKLVIDLCTWNCYIYTDNKNIINDFIKFIHL